MHNISFHLHDIYCVVLNITVPTIDELKKERAGDVPVRGVPREISSHEKGTMEHCLFAYEKSTPSTREALHPGLLNNFTRERLYIIV